ncbi:hypothetical protein HYFRA_00000861 [Hymenoscyphus fraxineus]|uniref:Chromo domain-containing protein n=1 Tax=Hymenoscyphus fraxineus TaxID=746836 RepID=A0A9N9KSY5_9HELO|nr:hypothetical protein HYFRA_00000861 [Hymenoscyphus fraxineus]
MFRKSVHPPPKAAAPPEDDNISLTSTQESIHSDGHEFVVDRILAQKMENKNRMYLILWDGYPLHRATWEPRGNIVDHRIFDEWTKRRAKERRGDEQPFDVAAFEAQLDRLDREKEARRSRRKLKKKRLGLAKQAGSSQAQDEDSSDSSSDEALEHDEVTDYKGTSRPPANPHRPKLPSGSNKTSVLQNTQNSSTKTIPSSKSALPDKAASSSKPLLLNQSSTSTSDSDAPQAVKHRKADDKISNLQSKSGSSNMQSKPSTSRGMGAVRGKSAYPNVFARRSPPRKDGRRGTLAEKAADPSKGQSHFKNLHLVNKAKLSAKDRVEATAPDVSVVGGLFKPGEGGPQFDPLKVPRRSSEAFSQTRAFENVGASMLDRPASSVASTVLDRNFSKSETTCYYWHAGNGASGACSRYYMCDFMHEYRPGHPIAPKPSFLYEETPRQVQKPAELRCFFYVKKGDCKFGDSCSKLHSDDESIPVAPNPNRKNEPCKFWLAGNCKYSKDECVFRHEDTEDTRAPTRADFTKATHVQVGQSSIPAVRRVKICPVFAAGRGFCQFGLACKYRHESPEEPTTESVSLTKSVSFAVDEDLELLEEPQSTIDCEAERQAQDKSAMPPPPVVNLLATNPNPPPVEDVSEQSDRAQDQSSMLPPQAADSTTSKPQRKKISISDYTRQKALSNLGARAKKFIFGGDSSFSLVMDIGDLGDKAKESCGLFLAPLTDITLDQEVMAKDLAGVMFLICQALDGYLVPRDNNDEVATIIDKVVKHCLLRCCGLLYSSQGFYIIVFPARSDDWRFLSLDQCPNDVQLRYIVFKTESSIGACLEIPATKSTISQTATPQNDALNNNTPTNQQNNLGDLVHKIYVDEIAPRNHSEVAFFFIFPTSAATVANFVAECLRRSHSNCKFYSGGYREWKSFLTADTFTHGSIIMHDDLARHVDHIPYVQKTLAPHLFRKSGEKKKQYSWWSITDGHQAGGDITLLPDTHARPEEERGPLESVNIFPFGAAILLTQSFLIAEPKRVYEILKWFFGKVENGRHIQGQMAKDYWKIVVPQGIVQYMYDLACAKDVESTRYLEENQHKPSREADAEKMGLGYATCALRFEIYSYLAELKHLGVIENPDNLWPHYCPTAGEVENETISPFIFPPLWIHTHDEIDLVHWFACWSSARIDSYRKIVVIGTNSTSRHKLQRLVKVPIGTEIPEEPAYRDGSLQTEFVPPLEIQALQPPQTPPSAQSTSGGGLDVDSQIVELLNEEKNKATLTSAGPQDGKVEFPFVQYPDEPVMEWKEKKYEHTTSWFRRLRAVPERNGVIFEAMLVDAWEKIFHYIGVPRR